MDVKKMLKFLFPEYQIIESIREYGFIATKENSKRVSTSFHTEIYSENEIASFGRGTCQIKQFAENNFNKCATADSNTGKYINNGKNVVKDSKDAINENFNSIRNELSTMIIGQKNFLDNLLIAFKRPFIAGYNHPKPKNTIFVIGEESSGRHTCIETTVSLLRRRKLLNYENISKMDLSIYPTPAEQSLFLSDLYKVLYANSEVIVFDCIEKCHSSILDIIARLVVDGKYKLNARYAFHNNNLVEATGVLMQNSFSELLANGNYFIFVTEQSESKVTDIFGSKFMAAVGDILKMEAYKEEELIIISEKLLGELNLRCKNKLSIILNYDHSLAQYCAGKYSLASGIAGIQNYIYENIYKALAEYKLRNPMPPFTTVELFIQNTEIMAKIIGKQGIKTFELMQLLPRKYINNLDEVKKELNSIIGLTKVKEYILDLENNFKIQKIRAESGFKTASISMHMIFTGNPGTGKTMVARTIADILYNIGVINTNKLIETDRAGLVAGYVGQTAIKTTEKVMEAIDGVLFIDEAYSLSQGGANDFGREAIDTLVKLMDDYRERLVVILAGYSKNMDDFLKANPGLKSRFPNIIEFTDYNLDELMQIANEFYQSKGYLLSEPAKTKLSLILKEAMKEEAFGNGRYVRNIFEKSVNNQALRLSTDTDLTRDELIVIEAEDIERV